MLPTSSATAPATTAPARGMKRARWPVLDRAPGRAYTPVRPRRWRLLQSPHALAMDGAPSPSRHSITSHEGTVNVLGTRRSGHRERGRSFTTALSVGLTCGSGHTGGWLQSPHALPTGGLWPHSSFSGRARGISESAAGCQGRAIDIVTEGAEVRLSSHHSSDAATGVGHAPASSMAGIARVTAQG